MTKIINKQRLTSTLITAAIIFFVVATLALIKLLFSHSKGFEWGSVTDTLSAAGSVGTLIIAIIALMKVPDWMAQKHYDIAYSIIENAIYKDLADVRLKSLLAKNLILNLTKNIVETVRVDGYNDNPTLPLEELMEKVEIGLDDFLRSTNGVLNQVKSISRTDYDISTNAIEITNAIQHVTKEFNAIYNRTFKVYVEYETYFFTDIKNKVDFEKELHEIRHDAINNNKYLSDMINQVYYLNRPIKDFIIRKKK
ncbi:hypothetical protein [Kluyvera sp. CRP]|uniref:hypothetical protein n=1 Tax=Kluyvera sp. CRP TaxID=2873269 RepID=UPI001CC1ECD6|nr:hypothetical protein [Kluyvera sp. CRP]UAK18528.1 hypothetical protein K7B04_14410 [Kluyvera sp. CRP]